MLPMNSLIPPANPSESYRAQLAALIQLGIPMVEKAPDEVPLPAYLHNALAGVEAALMTLRVALRKEETETQ